MQTDDETSVHQLHRLLKSRGYNISLCTILRCRTALGWTFCGSSYCQLIRHANKQKWLDWAERHTDLRLTMWYGRMSVQFSLNYTDDSAVESGDNQQRTNQGTLNAWQWCVLLAFCGHVHVTCIKGRMCLHINYTLHPLHFLFPPFRPKHPPKVHIWAGISQKGPTEVCIFEGKMNAPLYTQILD